MTTPDFYPSNFASTSQKNLLLFRGLVVRQSVTLQMLCCVSAAVWGGFDEPPSGEVDCILHLTSGEGFGRFARDLVGRGHIPDLRGV